MANNANTFQPHKRCVPSYPCNSTSHEHTGHDDLELLRSYVLHGLRTSKMRVHLQSTSAVTNLLLVSVMNSKSVNSCPPEQFSVGLYLLQHRHRDHSNLLGMSYACSAAQLQPYDQPLACTKTLASCNPWSFSPSRSPRFGPVIASVSIPSTCIQRW